MDPERRTALGLDVELPPRLEAPSQARQAIRETFSGRLPVRTVERLLTVVSELVTNSVVHGPGKAIKLTVMVDPKGSVRGKVEDEGEGQIGIREIEEDRPGGMGLRIVRALTDRWGVDEDRAAVWFELTAAGSGS